MEVEQLNTEEREGEEKEQQETEQKETAGDNGAGCRVHITTNFASNATPANRDRKTAAKAARRSAGRDAEYPATYRQLKRANIILTSVRQLKVRDSGAHCSFSCRYVIFLKFLIYRYLRYRTVVPYFFLFRQRLRSWLCKVCFCLIKIFKEFNFCYLPFRFIYI